MHDDIIILCAKIHYQASFAQNYSQNSSGHAILFHAGFLLIITSLFLWDSAQAKIYKFDFRMRGLVVKSASQTSSGIRAIIITISYKLFIFLLSLEALFNDLHVAPSTARVSCS